MTTKDLQLIVKLVEHVAVSIFNWIEHYVDDFIIGVLEFKEGSYFNVLLYSLVPYKTSFVSLYLIIKDLI